MKGLPPGWVWATLESLASAEGGAITDGPFGSNLKTAHYTQAGPRVVRLQNIGDGRFLDEQAHISLEHFNTLKRHQVSSGDLLIAALGLDIPRCCVAPSWLGPAVVKADVFRVRLHQLVNVRYVAAALNSPVVRETASGQISGIGRPRLNLAKTKALQLPLPPRREQDRIVDGIEAATSNEEAAVEFLRAAALKVGQRLEPVPGGNYLRRALLSQAVKGELVPQDPRDEPADRLVERIQEARALAVRRGSPHGVGR